MELVTYYKLKLTISILHSQCMLSMKQLRALYLFLMTDAFRYNLRLFCTCLLMFQNTMKIKFRQFYQYQQNEQLTLIKKQNTAYTDWNQWPGLGQTWICGGAKPINWIPTVSLDNESPISIKIETIAKTAYILFHLTHTHTISQKCYS